MLLNSLYCPQFTTAKLKLHWRGHHFLCVLKDLDVRQMVWQGKIRQYITLISYKVVAENSLHGCRVLTQKYECWNAPNCIALMYLVCPTAQVQEAEEKHQRFPSFIKHHMTL